MSPPGSLRWDALFPLARVYRGGGLSGRVVREESARFRAFPYTERHLQCVWFDPVLRPPSLQTAEGEFVEVVDPGVWNLEAGPDFLGAVVRVGPERRRLSGDVEIHIHPRDWSAHAHAADPRYARVRLHVTYFPGARPAEALPAGALQLALREPLAARPGFSFESVEIAAYPFAARATRPPCAGVLRGWDADPKMSVLDAAGQERLRAKSERLALRIEEAGAEQALYEELMAGLGYQHNKAAFRRLAARVPLAELRARAGTAQDAVAILFGVSGLLPASPSARWDAETRAEVRRLWDAWWRHQGAWAGRMMDRSEWTLQGRPANHPVRRLAAASVLFSASETPAAQWAAWAEKSPARALDRIMQALSKLQEPYWTRRMSWGGARSARAVALLGSDRACALAVNVAAPYLAACGQSEALAAVLQAGLPVEPLNHLARQTAHNLFGEHHPGSLYRTGLRRQGLLQIFHDFCLNDRSRCGACPFPALLAGWKSP